MTQLTVSIENPDMLRDIKKAIKMIRGVVSVKAEKPKPRATTLAAIEQMRRGEAIYCGSFEEYKKRCQILTMFNLSITTQYRRD